MVESNEFASFVELNFDSDIYVTTPNAHIQLNQLPLQLSIRLQYKVARQFDVRNH